MGEIENLFIESMLQSGGEKLGWGGLTELWVKVRERKIRTVTLPDT